MKIHRSRIGWEIWIPVTALLLAEGYTFVVNSIWVGLVIIGLLAAAMVTLILRTRYVIAQDSLLVDCFVVRQEINVKTIHRIRKTSSPVASPAMALIGRIEVFYENGKSVIISPRDKKQFIADLLVKNKSILTFEV